MKKTVLVGLAILAVSTSAALAKHHHHMMKPKAAAAAAPMAGPMMGPSAADMKMYKKNQHDSGMMGKKK